MGLVAWPIAAIRAGRDMNEVSGLDRFELVPHSARHDIGVARPQHHFRFHADRSFIAVVENQLDRSANDVQELVAVRMDLATMWWSTIDMRDRPDRVAIDSSRWTRRSGRDGHCPIARNVRYLPLEASR